MTSFFFFYRKSVTIIGLNLHIPEMIFGKLIGIHIGVLATTFAVDNTST